MIIELGKVSEETKGQHNDLDAGSLTVGPRI